MLLIILKQRKNIGIRYNDILNHFHDGLFLSMTMADFLKEWMIGHILGEDQEYVKWARENLEK